jgi:hypothetical protein
VETISFIMHPSRLTVNPFGPCVTALLVAIGKTTGAVHAAVVHIALMAKIRYSAVQPLYGNVAFWPDVAI